MSHGDLAGVLRAARPPRPGTPHDAGVREHAAACRTAGPPPERTPRRGRGRGPPRKPVQGTPARRRDAAQERHVESARRDGLARARHRHRPCGSGLPDRIAASDRDAAAARGAIGAHGRGNAEGAGVPRVTRRPGRVHRAVARGPRGRPRSHRGPGRAERRARAADCRGDSVPGIHGRRTVRARAAGVALSGPRAVAIRRRRDHARRRLRDEARPAGRADLPRRSAATAPRPPGISSARADVAAGPFRRSPTTGWCSSPTTPSSAR